MVIKVMTIVGTRPEIIKLSRVIPELDANTKHVLVHSGQNYDYELNEIFFQQLGLRKPDHFLNSAGESVAATIASVIARSDEVMEAERPDALLLLGDTNSCLSVISAKRRKIPIFHMEAGNRCFDQRVPEENNRKIVDHLSDVNLPYTEHARRYLLAEGIRPETVIKTGSPMREVLNYFQPAIKTSRIMEELGVTERGYLVVSIHREENVDNQSNFTRLLQSLNAVAGKYQKPVIVSTHPRTRKRLEGGGHDMHGGIRFLKPLGFLDYVNLQMSAFCVISDSGTITEESALLNFPAITVREAHERPEGMDEGTLIMTGVDADRILESIDIVTRQFDPEARQFGIPPDYQGANVSKKVLRIILSYTDYINRTVWQKN